MSEQSGLLVAFSTFFRFKFQSEKIASRCQNSHAFGGASYLKNGDDEVNGDQNIFWENAYFIFRVFGIIGAPAVGDLRFSSFCIFRYISFWICGAGVEMTQMRR